MGLSQPRSTFGVHSVSPYRRSDKTFYGIIKVLDSSSISLSAEQVDLFGGSNKYPWASEDGQITSEMTLNVSQMDDFMFELFLGKAPTKNTAEASGNVSAAVNVKGTSVIAATGILAPVVIPTTGAANLKFGKYVLKAKDADELEVYASSDIDFARGTDGDYTSDDLLIGTVSIATTANADLAAYGLRFTGGASVTAFTPGDTAEFEVRPINSGSSEVIVGAAADVFPEFGAIVMAQARSNGELFEIDAFRCKASGMPISFETFAWNKPEVKAKLLYDAAKNGVFKMRHLKG